MKQSDIIICLKAARKAAREAEIAFYGHSVCHFMIERSKKVYTRKEKHRKNIVFE